MGMCMQPLEDQGQGNTTRSCRTVTVLNNIKVINREVEGGRHTGGTSHTSSRFTGMVILRGIS